MTMRGVKGRNPRPAGKRVVAIYCEEYGQTWWPNWGPHSIEGGGKGGGNNGGDNNKRRRGGVGGSEEAAIFLANALAARGDYHVEIYADPPEEYLGRAAGSSGGGSGGVVWYKTGWYDASPAGAPDVFIAWRYFASVPLGYAARSRFLWLQDTFPQLRTQLTPSFVSKMDGIFTLSTIHTKALSPAAQAIARVTPNALDPRYVFASLRAGYTGPPVSCLLSSPFRLCFLRLSSCSSSTL